MVLCATGIFAEYKRNHSGESAGSGEKFFDAIGLLDHARKGLWAGLWENFVIRVRHGLEGKHCCGRYLSYSVGMGKSLAAVRSIKGGLKL